MSARRFVVEKVGDEYVPVPQDDHPRATRATWLVWGVALKWMGIRRHGPFRWLLIISGWCLTYRGWTGRTPKIVTRLVELLSTERRGRSSLAPSYQNDFTNKAPQLPQDHIDEASMESFPASDPPARSGVELPR